MQARAVDHLFLQLAGLLRGIRPQYRPHQGDGHLCLRALINGGAGGRSLDAKLAELANFFFKGHLRQQAFNRIVLG